MTTRVRSRACSCASLVMVSSCLAAESEKAILTRGARWCGVIRRRPPLAGEAGQVLLARFLPRGALIHRGQAVGGDVFQDASKLVGGGRVRAATRARRRRPRAPASAECCRRGLAVHVAAVMVQEHWDRRQLGARTTARDGCRRAPDHGKPPELEARVVNVRVGVAAPARTPVTLVVVMDQGADGSEALPLSAKGYRPW